MKVQESFADKFLNLVLKSKSDGGSNRFLISLLKLNPNLNKSIAGLDKVLSDINKKADQERKTNPDFARAEKDIAKIMKGN